MNYLALLGVLCLLPTAFVVAAYLIMFRRMPQDLEVRARKRWKLMSRGNLIYLLTVIVGLFAIAEGVTPASGLVKLFLSFLFIIAAFLPLVVALGFIDRRIREIDFPFGGYIKFQLFLFFARWLAFFVVIAFLFYPVDLVGPDGRIAPEGVGAMGAAAALFVLCSLYQMRIVGRITGALVPEGPVGAVGGDITRLSKKAKIGTVKVLFMNTYGYPFLNAFAAPGRIIYITRPLIDALTREELSAVAAHEIGHLVTMKMRTFLILTLMALFVVAVWVGLPQISPILSDIGTYLVPIALFAVLAIVLLVGIQVVGRRYETIADRISSEIMGGPEPMIAALEKIYRLNMLPRRFDKKGSENASHPSLERRVAQLRGEKLPRPRKRLRRILLLVVFSVLILVCLRLLRYFGERSTSGVYPSDSYGEVIRSLEERLAEDPDNFETLKRLAIEYYLIEEDGRALEMIHKALERAYDPGLLVLEGFILDWVGEQGGALFCMEEAYRVGASPVALRWAVALAAGRGDIEKARDYLSRLREADPTDPFAEEMERYLTGDGKEYPLPGYSIVFQGNAP